MKLANASHLAYCTNIHRGGSWAETLQSLDQYTLAVRDHVCPSDPYAIGLRLSANAASELADPQTLLTFQKWLEAKNCYVFTINGFPYGDFHGTRVKEQVYRPDWTSTDRFEYTKSLFDLLVQLSPAGTEGSVSTLPGSFKRFITSDAQVFAMQRNLVEIAQYVEQLSERTGRDLHLGMEPEPLGYFETSQETVQFYQSMLGEYPSVNELLLRRIGVNYDTCHLAVEYEGAGQALDRLTRHGIRISKIHLSAALKTTDFSPPTLQSLKRYCDDVYLHQVISKHSCGALSRYEDLDRGLAARARGEDRGDEWRIHFHIPLHSSPAAPLTSTSDHIADTLDVVKSNPDICHHYEMETYTWEVLPQDLANTDVVGQLVREYQWTIDAFAQRGLLPAG